MRRKHVAGCRAGWVEALLQAIELSHDGQRDDHVRARKGLEDAFGV